MWPATQRLRRATGGGGACRRWPPSPLPLLLRLAAVVAWLASAAVAGPYDTDTYSMDVRACEPIQIEMCKGLGYNLTAGPNFVGHDNQRDTELQLRTFSSLVQYGCSDQLLSFLCAVYVPMCSPKVEPLIGPCRQVCEGVQARCAPVLLSFGLPWPAALNCSKFPPVNQEGSMCMDIPTGGEAGAGSKQTGSRRPSPPQQQQKPPHPVGGGGGGGAPTRRRPTDLFSPQPPGGVAAAGAAANLAAATSGGGGAAMAPHPCGRYRNPAAYVHVNRTNECLPLCHADNAFSKESKEFTRVWIAVWSSLCFVSSAFAVVTFFLDAKRFRFPERPVAFLSLCYVLYSVGYAVRLVAGREEIICDASRLTVLLREGLDNANCAAVFLLLYYFGMAGSLWWVVLNVGWFLAAGLGWPHESIEVYSSYFHLVAWAVPAIQSIAVIVLRDVAGDELTGLCYVDGSRSRQTALGLVVLPSAAFLLLGLAFLVAGFATASCSRRRRLQRRQRPPVAAAATDAGSAAGVPLTAAAPTAASSIAAVKAAKVESLTARVGVYSVIYSVPAACLVACHLYEYANRTSWYEAAAAGPAVGGSAESPRVEVIMLRIFASLATGVISGLCVVSGQTLQGWSALCRRRTRRHRPCASSCWRGGDLAAAGGLAKARPSPVAAYAPVKLAPHPACAAATAAGGPNSHRVLLLYDKESAAR